MFEFLSDPNVWASLITLSVLEIVLGIDNLVIISILASGLPIEKQAMARRLGIGFALLTRIGLLFTISWLAGLTEPVFTIKTMPFSVRDLVMFFGGLFLLYKGAHELWEEMTAESHAKDGKPRKLAKSIGMVVFQIGLFDIIFSLDSVITAVGMANHLPVMVAAICIAMAVMLFASGPVTAYISKHISIKILALSFIVLIGIMLVAKGVHIEIPKGYIYFAMGFSAFVEFMVIKINSKKS